MTDTWAIIHEGNVIEVRSGAKPVVHHELEVVDAHKIAGIQVGWARLPDGTLVSPPDTVHPNAQPSLNDAAAASALAASDLVVLRCFENGVPFPSEWKAYRDRLRAILRAVQSGEIQPHMELPLAPPKPSSI